MKTVLGHVALQFVSDKENLATEALCFILQTSPAASRAFKEFLHPIGLDFPGELHFETQRGGLDQSIPDMTCRDDKGVLRVVVENKFWAGLTPNQPVTYIHQLPAETPSLLLFVVPEARLPLVWGEVVARCIAAKFSVREVQMTLSIIFADIGGRQSIAATSWGTLLDTLSTAASAAMETDCRNDIAQLQGLCGAMDQEEILPLRGDELTNLEMARRLINFSDLAIAIVDEAVSKGWCSREGVNETNYRHGSGARIRIGNYTPWLGFDAKSWLRLGVSPIWVYFYPPPLNPTAEIREKLFKFRASSPQRCFDSGRGLLVPIFLRTGVEKVFVVKDAVEQIANLVKELGVWETILEVGADGGSLSLFGKKDPQGHWQFWTHTDETTYCELLDEQDLRGLGSLVGTTDPVVSLAEAIGLLDRYPWYQLTPLHVHPAFRLAILEEVRKRGTQEEFTAWESQVSHC